MKLRKVQALELETNRHSLSKLNKVNSLSTNQPDHKLLPLIDLLYSQKEHHHHSNHKIMT